MPVGTDERFCCDACGYACALEEVGIEGVCPKCAHDHALDEEKGEDEGWE